MFLFGLCGMATNNCFWLCIRFSLDTWEDEMSSLCLSLRYWYIQSKPGC